MADPDDPRRERLNRAASPGKASSFDMGRHGTAASPDGHGGASIGKRTLAEGWGGGALSVDRNAAVCSVAADAARRQLATLTASQRSGGHDAASDSAHPLRLTLQTARDFATADQLAALAELEAEAAPFLMPASTLGRAPIDGMFHGQGEDRWAVDVAAYRASREHAWMAAAAPIAAQLGVDATIRIDDAATARGARGLAHAGIVHLVPTLAPEHAEARHILAHELVHVAQSRSGRMASHARMRRPRSSTSAFSSRTWSGMRRTRAMACFVSRSPRAASTAW